MHAIAFIILVEHAIRTCYNNDAGNLAMDAESDDEDGATPEYYDASKDYDDYDDDADWWRRVWWWQRQW